MVVSPCDDCTTPLEASVLSLPYRLSWIREDPHVLSCVCHEIISNGQLLRQRAKDKPAVFHRRQAEMCIIEPQLDAVLDTLARWQVLGAPQASRGGMLLAGIVYLR